MLENALESIKYVGIAAATEIVVVDGAEDFRVAELAKRFGTTLISGHDLGIYDAWNKGIAVARGEVIGFLNDDDQYLPGVVGCLSSFLQSGHDVLSGVALRADHQPCDNPQQVMPHEIGLLNVVGSPNAINARFFRREIINILPAFDETLRIWGDKAWLAEMYFLRPSTLLCPEAIYFYRTHAESLTLGRAENRSALGIERIDALTRLRAKATLSMWSRAAVRFWLDLAHAHEILAALRMKTELTRRPDGGFLLWGIRTGLWLVLMGLPLIVHRRHIVQRRRGSRNRSTTRVR